MRQLVLHSSVVAILLAWSPGCSNPNVEGAAAPAGSAPSAASTAAAVATGADAPAADAKTLVRSGSAVVLDVRTPGEFSGGHLDRATNIPVDELPSRLADVDKLTGGDKSKPIVVYCARGSRAARAKMALDGAGYTAVVNGGGIDDLR